MAATQRKALLNGVRIKSALCKSGIILIIQITLVSCYAVLLNCFMNIYLRLSPEMHFNLIMSIRQNNVVDFTRYKCTNNGMC